jgi:peptidoglycan/LPS O-acetylase OafA/YrhL
VTFLASYSYSLYLIHNTVLIIVLEQVNSGRTWVNVTIAVVAAHCCAYLLYLTFERHYRVVGGWLRPMFDRALAPRGELPASLATHLLPGRPAPMLGRTSERGGHMDVRQVPRGYMDAQDQPRRWER